MYMDFLPSVYGKLTQKLLVLSSSQVTHEELVSTASGSLRDIRHWTNWWLISFHSTMTTSICQTTLAYTCLCVFTHWIYSKAISGICWIWFWLLKISEQPSLAYSGCISVTESMKREVTSALFIWTSQERTSK